MMVSSEVKGDSFGDKRFVVCLLRGDAACFTRLVLNRFGVISEVEA